MAEQPDTWQITEHRACVQCGYDLIHLTGPTVACPECGQRHNLSDPYVWRINDSDYSTHRASPISFIAFFNMMILFWGGSYALDSESCTAVVWALAALLLGIRMIQTLYHWHRYERAHRTPTPMIIAGYGVLLFTYGTAPAVYHFQLLSPFLKNDSAIKVATFLGTACLVICGYCVLRMMFPGRIYHQKHATFCTIYRNAARVEKYRATSISNQSNHKD